MTRLEFGPLMDKLIDTFGDRHFNNARVNKIWEMFKPRDAAIFERAVESILADTPINNPPTPNEMLNIYSRFNRDQNVYKPSKCSHCRDQGFIFCLNRENPTDPLLGEDFACPFCEVGKHRKDLRQWREIDSQKYIMRFKKENLVKNLVSNTMKGVGE